MANVQHSTLTGASLHEPKGVAAASANRVYVSNGAGSGSWTTVSTDVLASTAKSFQAQLFHAQDQKSSGTAGGTSVNGGTRDINTVVTNEISGASLASNQITLPAGTYYIEASAPLNSGGGSTHKAYLYNVTDGGNTVLGTSEYSSPNGSITRSHILGRFTISSTKTFEIRHGLSSPQGGNGWGVASSVSTEVYTEARIWKIA